jgi:hypothetical protein
VVETDCAALVPSDEIDSERVHAPVAIAVAAVNRNAISRAFARAVL